MILAREIEKSNGFSSDYESIGIWKNFLNDLGCPFTAKHLTMFGLFGVALSKRRAEKKKNYVIFVTEFCGNCGKFQIIDGGQ